MTRKQVGRNDGNPGWINVSGSELDKLGLDWDGWEDLKTFLDHYCV